MKYLRHLTTLAGVMLLLNTPAVGNDNYDFRKTRWDMPIVQVKAIEDLKHDSKFLKEIPVQNSGSSPVFS